MTELIIYRFKSVKIQIQQGQLPILSCRGHHSTVDAIVEQSAVRDAGKLVIIRQFPKASFRVLAV